MHRLLEPAFGGRMVTQNIEGKERYAVRLYYPDKYTQEIEAMNNIPLVFPDGTLIRLQQIASLDFVPVPQVIKSEDGFMSIT